MSYKLDFCLFLFNIIIYNTIILLNIWRSKMNTVYFFIKAFMVSCAVCFIFSVIGFFYTKTGYFKNYVVEKWNYLFLLDLEIILLYGSYYKKDENGFMLKLIDENNLWLKDDILEKYYREGIQNGDLFMKHSDIKKEYWDIYKNIVNLVVDRDEYQFNKDGYITFDKKIAQIYLD